MNNNYYFSILQIYAYLVKVMRHLNLWRNVWRHLVVISWVLRGVVSDYKHDSSEFNSRSVAWIFHYIAMVMKHWAALSTATEHADYFIKSDVFDNIFFSPIALDEKAGKNKINLPDGNKL